MTVNRLLSILITIFISLHIACTDRLIILFDEAPLNLLGILETINVIEPLDIQNINATFQANAIEGAVDIIMVVDSSGSMSEEMSKIKNFINTLSSTIGNSGLDYHFIMITPKGTGTFEIEVPSPLGTSNRFMHINTSVGSWDSYSKIIDNRSQYKSFLRNNSVLNIIVVSDDDADSIYLDWNAFKNAMANYIRPNFTVHGIVGLDASHPNIYAVGQQYIKGANATGGEICDINANNWDSLFINISDNIINQMPDTVYTFPEIPYIANGNNPEYSFIVEFNGMIIPSANNWQFNSVTNQIEFLNPNLLEDGGTINVSYTTSEQLPAETIYYLENEPYISDGNNPETSFIIEIDGNEIPFLNNWKYNLNSNSIQFLNTSLLNDGAIINIYYKIKP